MAGEIEQLRRNYTREEEFLDEFPYVAGAATRALDGAWRPQYDSDDRARQQRDYFISSGELDSLVFDSAAVFENGSGNFSSAQITVRTAKRLVTVRVSGTRNGPLTAEKIVDRKGSG